MSPRTRITPRKAAALLQRREENWASLYNVEVDLCVELGRKDMRMRELAKLRVQDVIELDKLAGEAFDIRVNNRAFAEGEVVVVADRMAVRVTKMQDYSLPVPSAAEVLSLEIAALEAHEELTEDPEPEEGSGKMVAEVARLGQQLSTMRGNLIVQHDNAGALGQEWDDLENRRRELLPEANAQRMVMIPAGAFPMGSRGDDSPNNERPVHPVYLQTYYISPFPVTNLEYQEFVNCTGYKAPMHWQRGSYPTGTGRHPVTNVSWHDAKAYAEWQGARLPTEAEWEKAARGTDERLYPWGPRFGEDRCNCNNMTGGTLPVDEYPNGRSPHGLWDMAGNVYEWCEDYYDGEYYKNCPNNNPKGPLSGQERVIRGGSYQENRPAVRTTHREGTGEHITREVQGFRLAMDA